MSLTIQLIHGQFDAKDALDLVTVMLRAKIKFHESRITSNCEEEDVKMRENKIKLLQNDLNEARKLIEGSNNLNIESTIELF